MELGSRQVGCRLWGLKLKTCRLDFCVIMSPHSVTISIDYMLQQFSYFEDRKLNLTLTVSLPHLALEAGPRASRGWYQLVSPLYHLYYVFVVQRGSGVR